MGQWGFVSPTRRTRPTSNPSLMSHPPWNRIKAMPGIESVQGDDVRLTDGSSKRFDAVIAATGCAVDLPFLDPPPPLRPLEGRKLELFLRVGRPHQSACPSWDCFTLPTGEYPDDG